jgi:N-formylmaleamate deformylase
LCFRVFAVYIFQEENLMLSHWTQNDIVINGAKLHYIRTGDGSLPPLVLQHGFSDNGLCWSPTAQVLEAEYDIIMPDARGHGLSARVQPGEEIDMTADLAELIRTLGLERPIVAGHSMGASIASQLGARFPDVPRALVLEDPPWRDFMQQPPSGNADPFDKWFREMAELTVEQIVERNRAEHPTWPEDVLRTWCAAKKQLDLNLFVTMWIDDNMEWREIAKAITCPTLLITADPDKGGIVTPESAAEAVEINPNISVVHIPGTGHHIRFTDYDTYMDAVRTFLQEIG